jgi:predicted nucleotidyltransferase
MMDRPIVGTSIRERLRRRRPELLAAAARRGASNLRVFGSVARGDEGAESDVDFLVDHAYHRLDYARVWNTLRDDIPRLRAAIERYRAQA